MDRVQDIRIVEADAPDAEEIAGLVRQLAAAEDESSPITPDYVKGYLAGTGCHVLLARARDRAVGLISYSLRPGLFHAALSCVIEDLFVSQDHRGRGLGRSLVADVLARAREARCAEVSVTTATDNAKAIALYRGMGMTDESVFLEKHSP